MITDCCKAEYIEDTEICSECGEHAIESDEDEDCCMARSVGFPEHCHCIKARDEDEDAAYEDYLEGKYEDERLNDD